MEKFTTASKEDIKVSKSNKTANIDVCFNNKIKDFQVHIKGSSNEYLIIISNERIEYFIKHIQSDGAEQETLKTLFQNCSVVFYKKAIEAGNYSKIQLEGVINDIFLSIQNDLDGFHDLLMNSLDTAKNNPEVNKSDFPRHPLNRLQTNKIIDNIKKYNLDLINNDVVTINSIPIEFENVSEIFNKNRVDLVDTFKNTFRDLIQPIIYKNCDKWNFFIITEKEKGEQENEQKHTFLVIHKENNIFILDSAGHEKYENLIIPNVEMFRSFLDANKQNKIYYNNTRIQADHVNCYTIAIMTMKNFLNRIADEYNNKNNNGKLLDELKSFFQQKKENFIFREYKMLPLEFLVNTQINTLFLELNKICNKKAEFACLKHRFKKISKERKKHKENVYYRDVDGRSKKKKQIKNVDKERAGLLLLSK